MHCTAQIIKNKKTEIATSDQQTSGGDKADISLRFWFHHTHGHKAEFCSSFGHAAQCKLGYYTPVQGNCICLFLFCVFTRSTISTSKQMYKGLQQQQQQRLWFSRYHLHLVSVQGKAQPPHVSQQCLKWPLHPQPADMHITLSLAHRDLGTLKNIIPWLDHYHCEHQQRCWPYFFAWDEEAFVLSDWLWDFQFKQSTGRTHRILK